VKNQHAADAERPVARARAEQKLLQVCGGEISGSGAGIDNLMHTNLVNSRRKA
jgi:phage baseplate assembly protein gpV